MSVVSNAALVSFTVLRGPFDVTTNVGRLLIFIAIEHISFSAKALIALAVPDVTVSTALQLARQKYLVDKHVRGIADEIDLFELDVEGSVDSGSVGGDARADTHKTGDPLVDDMALGVPVEVGATTGHQLARHAGGHVAAKAVSSGGVVREGWLRMRKGQRKGGWTNVYFVLERDARQLRYYSKMVRERGRRARMRYLHDARTAASSTFRQRASGRTGRDSPVAS